MLPLPKRGGDAPTPVIWLLVAIIIALLIYAIYLGYQVLVLHRY